MIARRLTRLLACLMLVLGTGIGVRATGGEPSADGPVGHLASPAPAWTATANTMSVARMNHTATLLHPLSDPSHVAKVLVCGGRTASGSRTNTAELYNPATNTFAATGSMACAREQHSATLLLDGRVLVVGGLTAGDGLPGGGLDQACPVAEIYNPSAGTWISLTSATPLPIWGHAASRIEAGAQAGKVLITGGRTAPLSKPTPATYLFNPSTGTFQSLPSLPASRYLHGQVSQQGGGRVVVGGGKCPDCSALNPAFETDTNRADPTKIDWVSVASTGLFGEGPVLLRLGGNNVLIAGGGNSGAAASSSQTHIFGSSGWNSSGTMSTGRRLFAGTLLSDGRALTVGGTTAAGAVLNTAEVFTLPATWSTDPAVITPMNVPRASLTLTAMQAGQVLATGGVTTGGAVTSTAEVLALAPVQPPLCSPATCDPATSDCVGDVCVPRACAPGTSDCDGSPANGCETLLSTPGNCGACGNTCSANGACDAGAGGSFACRCNAGYAGNGNTCSDIDECVSFPCGANATCTNLPGSYACTCNAGYAGNGFVCTDINECAGSPCGANSTCTNTPGSFSCGCNAGFGDCDGLAANGCETNLNALTNCGSCGTSCDDGSACTDDSCVAGTCTHAGRTCSAPDQCHEAGTCNPATGLCSNPAKPAGSACGDPSAGQCDAPDTCNGAGACLANHVLAGTSCGDTGTECVNQDICDGNGSCSDTGFKVAGTACGNSSNSICDNADACNGTGTCSSNHVPDGSACSDDNACSQTDTCQGGVCTGTNQINCGVSDQCHDHGTCDPNTGLCSNPARPNGSACDDGNECSQTDTCQFGVCTGGSLVVCNAQDDCHDAGTCDPATGLCSNPAKPDNSACSFSNGVGVCVSGTCMGECATGFADCDGSPANGCETDLTTPSNCGGCGNLCSQGAACVNGQCASVCSVGQTLCSSGCADLSSDASNCGACGNLCPAGSSCVSGQCSCATGQPDTTPPTIVFGSRDPAANVNGWNRTDVFIPYTVSDACGVDSVSPGSPLLFSSEGFGQTQTVTACDHSGNCATAVSPEVSIDVTPPSLISLSHTGIFFGVNVQITAAGSDIGSGFATSSLTIPEWSVSKQFVHSLESTIIDTWTVRATTFGPITILWSATDGAGNVYDSDVQIGARLPDASEDR
jgi:hypothetical protein